MIELIQEYYMVSVLLGSISLMITLLGGWVFTKGLNLLKADIDVTTKDS